MKTLTINKINRLISKYLSDDPIAVKTDGAFGGIFGYKLTLDVSDSGHEDIRAGMAERRSKRQLIVDLDECGEPYVGFKVRSEFSREDFNNLHDLIQNKDLDEFFAKLGVTPAMRLNPCFYVMDQDYGSLSFDK